MLLSYLFLLDVMVYFYWEKEIEVMNVSRCYFVTVICLLWMGRIDLHFMLCREFWRAPNRSNSILIGQYQFKI